MRLLTNIPLVFFLICPTLGQDPQAVGDLANRAFQPTIQQEKLAGLSATYVTDLKTRLHAFEPLPRANRTKLRPELDDNTALEEVMAKAEQEARDSEKVFDPSFDTRGALIQSGLFLAIQHGYRMTEEKTRRELDGPFFKDWKQSFDQLHGWYDGGRLFTNYVAHPMQGAMTARIFINNSGKAKATEFGRDKAYWAGRVKAFAWALAWSTQFEIGPISEASLGNIGKQLYDGHKSKLTYGDIVVTPAAGFGWTVGEDAIDKFILRRWIERRIDNRLLIKLLRSVITPTQALANVLRGRAPWRRDHRRN